MAAQTAAEDEKRRRRRRVLRGLVLGGAAVGIPALANLLVARRAGPVPAPLWGRSHRYAWSLGEVVFQQLGQGPPAVLLHAFGPGYDAEQWRSAAELLARERRVYAPDFLGWGRSDKPAMVYDGELYIRLLADFLADAVGEQAVVAAAGLAAAYAVEVAVDRPELISALCLVGPQGLDLGADEPDLADALLHRALHLPVLGTAALNVFTSRPALARHLQEAFARPERVDAVLIDHHYRSSHQPGARHALSALLAGYLNHRVDQSLPKLGQPVWLGWGRQATSPPVEGVDPWLRLVPRAEIEIFEGSGNLPHQEVPGLFCQRLGHFLEVTA